MAGRQKSYEIDMIHGPLLGKVLSFAIPLLFSGILQLLFNAADLIVVGRFSGDIGPQCMGAVGSTISTINLLISLFLGLSVGVNVLVARYYASQNRDRLERTVHTAVALALFGGLVMAAIGIGLSRAILTAMNSPDDVIDLATLYMRIYFIGMPVNLLYNFGSAVMRAVGDTKRPLYFLIISGIVNVVFNLFFVVVLKINVAGVALATILSQALSAVLILRCLIRTEEAYRLKIRRIRIAKDELIQIVKIGLPAGLQSALFSISNMLIQSSVNSFGSIAMAGSSAALNIEGFIYISMNSLYQACISFTSQNYGAKKFERLGKVLMTCCAVVTVVGLVFGVGSYLLAPKLVGIYTDNARAVLYGAQRLAAICPLYFCCGLMEVICGSVRGMGYSMATMIIALMGACGFRILWIYTVFRAHRTLDVLFYSYPISWILTGLAQLVCFFIVRKKVLREHEANLYVK